MEFAILIMTILFVSLFQIGVPFFVKRTVVFGVTIPYEQARHPKVMHYKKLYAMLTTIVAFVAIVGFFIWNQANPLDETKLVLIGSIAPFVILLTGLAFYFYFHYKITKLKKAKKWFGEVKQVRVADLTARAKDEMLSSFFHFIPTVIAVTLIILSVNLFDQLPNQIPTHWGPDGMPDAFTDKSWLSVLNLPIMLIVLQVMFFGINFFTKRSGIKINAGNMKSSKLRQLRLRKYTSWFLFVTNILMTLLFAFLQLNLLYENLFSHALLVVFPVGFTVIMLVGALVLAVKVGSVDSDLEGKLVVDQSGKTKTESIDEDRYWKGGLVYFNPNDPSVFVEKRFGIGWTLNFANPIGYFVLILPIVLIFVFSFLI
ncbi:hypothetical protein BN1058_00149 [Paraliobacillus sp. PM-2]|uniref:DUF1648 domain-containing protein n=1 Tax=Paraliobacillus sp. PM-2 TaxID=1462524 RepID=UPI00061C5E1B|nr:DUF5808 domain-containing protein [Paraliobacillus sp. PM-2]CQR45908.1 hypothetical protein BN1058_00149 [Paraliobacillus sp. PM-2]